MKMVKDQKEFIKEASEILVDEIDCNVLIEKITAKLIKGMNFGLSSTTIMLDFDWEKTSFICRFGPLDALLRDAYEDMDKADVDAPSLRALMKLLRKHADHIEGLLGNAQ